MGYAEEVGGPWVLCQSIAVEDSDTNLRWYEYMYNMNKELANVDKVLHIIISYTCMSSVVFSLFFRPRLVEVPFTGDVSDRPSLSSKQSLILREQSREFGSLHIGMLGVPGCSCKIEQCVFS
jgi:hypothetical protein